MTAKGSDDFCKAITDEVKMTRFQILALLSGQDRALSCTEVAQLTGHPRWYSRNFRASLHAQLRRLWRWGLLRRRRARWRRPAHSRSGIYLWSISRRGQERLAWAKSERLIP
jgi:hypothetical protein